MKKLLLIILCLCLLLIGTPLTAHAESQIAEQILQDTLDTVESISPPALNFSDTTKQLLSGSFSLSFDEALEWLLSLIFKEIQENLSTLVKMLVLAILAGILCNLQQSAQGSTIEEVAFLACLSVIAGLSVSLIAGLSALTAETINSMMLFIASLMPVLCSLVSSPGQAAINGFYPVLFLSMQAFVAICRQFFLPLISVTTALSVVNSMSNRFQIAGLVSTTQKIIKWALGLLLTVFVGILGLHGFSAFATGSVAGRTVKYALCNFVPLVGSVLAESVEAVITGVRLIRGSVGITGVLSLLVFCSLPLIKILTASFLYRFTAAIAEPATDNRITKLLMDLSGNITLLFSILLMVTVMFIISIALLCGFFF